MEIVEEVRVAVEALRSTGDAPLDPTQSQALAVLYHRYASPLRQVARRYTIVTSDAEDIVHDVFAKLPVWIRRFQGDNLEGWLSRVVGRAALRHRGRTRECPFDETTISREPDNGVWDWSARTELRDAIAALPDSLRQVAALRLLHGSSHREISASLKISVGASEIRLCRAVKLLRATLHRALANPGPAVNLRPPAAPTHDPASRPGTNRASHRRGVCA